jgi:hypothetical protein
LTGEEKMESSLGLRVGGAVLTIMCSSTLLCADNADLVLEAELYSADILERLPLVAKLILRNVGDEVLHTRFSDRNVEIVARYSALVLTDGERVYRLTYIGGPQPNIPLQPADEPLPPRASIVVERVLSLILRTRPPRRSVVKGDDLYKFIPPGLYTGHFEVNALPEKKLVSDHFQLRILEAQGVDAQVRDLIQFRHVGFLEGRDVPLDEAVYRGGRSRHGADWTRYREIQEILEKYPDSTYAEWIRFWKLYYHGPVEDALQYAREHRDFPLADNLMLRVAEGLFNQAGKYDRAAYDRGRELVAELLRDFPDGDTRARALELQRKLTKKP